MGCTDLLAMELIMLSTEFFYVILTYLPMDSIVVCGVRTLLEIEDFKIYECDFFS